MMKMRTRAISADIKKTHGEVEPEVLMKPFLLGFLSKSGCSVLLVELSLGEDGLGATTIDILRLLGCNINTEA